MKSPSLAVISLFCLWFAGEANAQLAAPDNAGAPDSQHTGVPPTLRHGEEETRPEKPAQTTSDSSSICLVIEAAAAANGLPLEFFARVIWQESRFRADAVGPVTRSGLRARGIAQFMPVTAAERLLHDPFDPV